MNKTDFPIFTAHPTLAYLDSAASTQKPSVVIKSMSLFYETEYANVHRGIYPLSERATERYEEARLRMAQFINALPEEIVFTSGTTDSINKIARMLVSRLSSGDEILITIAEHHSNLVVWQQLAKEKGAVLKILPLTADMQRVDWSLADKFITENTKIVAVTHSSNVLGDVAPLQELAVLAHQRGALVVVDGAQAIAHMSVDVKALGVDAYCFSGHKMYGPTGIGVLYARKKLLDELRPVVWGGEMVDVVTLEKTTFADTPTKFEAGTPNIAGAVGLGVAVDYLRNVTMNVVAQHEHEILSYALEKLKSLSDVAVLGPQTAERRGGAIAFVIDGVHPHDAAHILASHAVAVRAGNHCAQPLHQALGIGASLRASIGIYTTKEDIDALVLGIKAAQEVFK